VIATLLLAAALQPAASLDAPWAALRIGPVAGRLDGRLTYSSRRYHRGTTSNYGEFSGPCAGIFTSAGLVLSPAWEGGLLAQYVVGASTVRLDGGQRSSGRVQYFGIGPSFIFRLARPEVAIGVAGQFAYLDKSLEMSRGLSLLLAYEAIDGGSARLGAGLLATRSVTFDVDQARFGVVQNTLGLTLYLLKDE
jgi:hypothetical protein